MSEPGTGMPGGWHAANGCRAASGNQVASGLRAGSDFPAASVNRVESDCQVTAIARRLAAPGG